MRYYQGTGLSLGRTLNFICPSLQTKAMKFIPIILSVILATSALGYGMASAQQMGAAGAGGGTPCTASQPCAPICGNHLCAPGEVPGQTAMSLNASSTKTAQSTNSTGSPSMAEQMGVSANATATIHHGNMTGNMTNGAMPGNMTMGSYHHGNMTGNMANGTMPSKMTNGTMTTSTMSSMPMTSTLPSPNAQVTAGTPSTSVKCMSGFSLVINNENSRPACVTQSTMSLLVARGWGHAAS